MNMTQTTASPPAEFVDQWVALSNPPAPVWRPDVLQAIDAYVALVVSAPKSSQAALIYEMLSALRRAGVDVFDLVPCVLAEVE